MMSFGLPDDLWNDILKLQQINRDYCELASTFADQLDYRKVMNDEFFKWKVLSRWVNAIETGHPECLKVKPSFHVVLKEILCDEPLCFEAIFHPLTRKLNDYCKICPLYGLTGKNCYEEGSVKEIICRPLRTWKGIFRPFEMCKLLIKIRTGSPIKEIEVLKNARKASSPARSS